jgi:hypothetical protein
LALAVKTWEALEVIVGDVHHDQSRGLAERKGFIRHPIRPTMEAAHLHDVADDVESALATSIVARAVLAFVVPFAAILGFPVFGIAPLS